MKLALCAGLLAVLVTPAYAQKSCDELKSEIDARIQSQGVKAYTLEIVAKGEAKDAKVVGTCEGGTKEVTYKRL